MKRIVDKDGTIYYYNDEGQLHREDGPAIEDPNGDKFWYINGKRHREDGPAVEDNNGYKVWYINGHEHRLDGPARIWKSFPDEWWINGEHINCTSQEEFERLLKMKAFW